MDADAETIRIDRLLVYLRLARTRSVAQAMIEARALRCNRKHVLRGSEQVRKGDVLTVATGPSVRIVEVLSLPQRRASPAAARSHYREVDAAGLDPKGEMNIAASPLAAARQPDNPEDLS